MREIIIPAKEEVIYIEEIHAYTHVKSQSIITIAVGLCDSNGDFIEDQDYETLALKGQDYIDMLSENGGPESPSPGKPAGTFRKDDMWYFIDLIRSRFIE